MEERLSGRQVCNRRGSIHAQMKKDADRVKSGQDVYAFTIVIYFSLENQKPEIYRSASEVEFVTLVSSLQSMPGEKGYLLRS